MIFQHIFFLLGSFPLFPLFPFRLSASRSLDSASTPLGVVSSAVLREWRRAWAKDGELEEAIHEPVPRLPTPSSVFFLFLGDFGCLFSCFLGDFLILFCLVCKKRGFVLFCQGRLEQNTCFKKHIYIYGCYAYVGVLAKEKEQNEFSRVCVCVFACLFVWR